MCVDGLAGGRGLSIDAEDPHAFEEVAPALRRALEHTELTKDPIRALEDHHQQQLDVIWPFSSHGFVDLTGEALASVLRHGEDVLY
eukprot:CAMPEP_0170616064 /NCGR_PEP_ID=MMETSP0224-20130122/25674_1 /TAXON_ID=285029 /ORGANISM="Togula jolla, Strain CCCM 725" /LENGTH=85 /DNA_ID=CAMNT_0010941843 /DNA_START=193 /DNA_END=450 /DNA_ORIENTATION=-